MNSIITLQQKSWYSLLILQHPTVLEKSLFHSVYISMVYIYYSMAESSEGKSQSNIMGAYLCWINYKARCAHSLTPICFRAIGKEDYISKPRSQVRFPTREVTGSIPNKSSYWAGNCLYIYIYIYKRYYYVS